MNNFSCTPGRNASAHKSMHLVLMEMLAKSLQSLGAAVPEPVILPLFYTRISNSVYLVVSDYVGNVSNEVICPL